MARRQVWRGTLATRLIIGFAIVIALGGLTAFLVAEAVGPSTFDAHLARAGLSPTSEAVQHARAAFVAASGKSLLLGLAAASVASLGVSIFAARRVGRSLRAFSDAASRVARGEEAALSPTLNAGAEFDSLADDFRRMAAQLAQAERLRKRLISDVAHELRTPVATLAAYLEGIEDGVRPLDGATLEVLRSSTARLVRLVTDLAEVTSAEAGASSLRAETIRVGVLAAAAIAAAAPAFDAKGVSLDAEGASEVQVRADPDRFGQILGNLLDNALRHTAAGGRVTVRWAPAGATVRIVVVDSGEGIGAEHIGHIFDRFYRVDAARDRERGGSGVGLAVVKGLVEAHGGRVTVESDGMGAGSAFTIVMPGVGRSL
ncbi:sensor histidine kinase [Demequina lutea]|uniref:histidine kinase n=1 Tax=Demequina lutea TaxID=431489 RepID=A0A7Y9Z7R2_9MICO|nr:HAMP domain-containing sensor histidine kinase [Demequina lutea]NYI40309.1 signal transduction histidine kinase [Demequina lutea]